MKKKKRSAELHFVRPDKKYLKTHVQAIVDIDPSVEQEEDFLERIENDIERYRQESEAHAMWWLMRGEQYIGDFSFPRRIVEEFAEYIHWDVHVDDSEYLKLDRTALKMGLRLVEEEILKKYAQMIRSGELVPVTAMSPEDKTSGDNN